MIVEITVTQEDIDRANTVRGDNRFRHMSDYYISECCPVALAASRTFGGGCAVDGIHIQAYVESVNIDWYPLPESVDEFIDAWDRSWDDDDTLGQYPDPITFKVELE